MNLTSKVLTSVSIYCSKGHENVQPACQMECPGCSELAPSNRFYPVTYKTIIGHFDHLLSLAAADPVSSE